MIIPPPSSRPDYLDIKNNTHFPEKITYHKPDRHKGRKGVELLTFSSYLIRYVSTYSNNLSIIIYSCQKLNESLFYIVYCNMAGHTFNYAQI